ncbi:hypothetical protein SAMN02745121_04368 [Nannocystis exedens]|uniref:Uncharacterized protein n=2 Tax=Nannocystis exedens TaxID=54 RepID=A0A1I2AU26_9BACT|nr:hypothetical protein NAEX_07354 [Nannocystis exedens]SFE47239.1 hypothetical protein SAMN02745121_04368 [Nannocystis exedens]
MNVHTLILPAFAVLAASMAGCDPAAPESAERTEWLQPLADEDDDFVEADNPVIAAIDSDAPGKIEFLDESEITGEPTIGVVAIGPEGRRALALFDAADASPLEVFLALSPTGAAPRALVEDHARLAADGRVPTAPRELQLWREIDDSSEMCQLPTEFEDFWDDWSSGFGSTNQTTSGYFNGVTIESGSSKQRALIACLISGTAATTMRLRMQIAAGVWGSPFYTLSNIQNNFGLAYRSTSTADAKYREEVVGGNYYHLGASW